MNALKKQTNALKKKIFVIITVLIWSVVLILVPVMLKLTWIKQLFLYLLSFTSNADYKIVYVEFWGTIIGSFIAIWGALFVQRKIDKKAELSIKQKYACVIYYDLFFAFKDLKDIFEETKLVYKLQCFDNKTDVDKFCEVAKGRKIYLNPT